AMLCFFFSSRRRHTRFSRDWSSDVCSSDLLGRRRRPRAGAEGDPHLEPAPRPQEEGDVTSAPRAARPTPPPISGHQVTLEGLRAVAALAVLVYHVAATAGSITNPAGARWLFNGGQVGVPIFFALSGLLLYRPWAAAALD